MKRTSKATRRDFLRDASTTTAAFALAGGAPWVARADTKFTLKIATLAPQGSSWMNTFQAVARDVKKETNGELSFKLYGGGVMGDENAMVRKMRTGQLDGAAVTNVGLGDIDKQLLMLQLPLLFRSYDELDKVRTKMMPKFEALLAKAGFVLSGWGDVGFQYFFSNTPVAVPADLKSSKVWVWDADPIGREVMKVAGINAVPLGVPDVLPSLQTGVIDAFANSPYGAVALQWYTKAKFIMDLKFAVVIGGSVLSTKSFEKLPVPHREALARVSAKAHGQLLGQIRRDNEAAVATLKAKGLTVVSPKNFPEWKAIADKTRQNLASSIFDPALLKEMLGYL